MENKFRENAQYFGETIHLEPYVAGKICPPLEKEKVIELELRKH
jgi:hypothetical protein